MEFKNTIKHESLLSPRNLVGGNFVQQGNRTINTGEGYTCADSKSIDKSISFTRDNFNFMKEVTSA